MYTYIYIHTFSCNLPPAALDTWFHVYAYIYIHILFYTLSQPTTGCCGHEDPRAHCENYETTHGEHKVPAIHDLLADGKDLGGKRGGGCEKGLAACKAGYD